MRKAQDGSNGSATRSVNSFRSMLVTGACAVLAATSLEARAGSLGEVRLVVQSSPLAGFRYYEARDVWSQLVQGMELTLVREPANSHDPNAIRVEWRCRILGYVPRRENAALAWGLDRGEALRARISRLSWHANPARRIEFEVFMQ